MHNPLPSSRDESNSFFTRARNRARAVFLLPLRAAVTVLVAAVFLTGCAVGSFELTRPDGVTVKANAFALFRDTGLENFTYTVSEDTKDAGLLGARATRNASVGASGYSGTTRAETLLKLLEALP